MRFVKENAIVDEFLFCQEMKERTRAKDVFDLVNAFLRENFIAEMNGNEQLNLHEQHLELQSSQAAKTEFSSTLVMAFWCSMF